MRFVLPLVCLGFCLELLACGNNSTTTTTIARPELVAVQPSDFLGQIPCDPKPKPPDADAAAEPEGAPVSSPVARSYVATLFDVTDVDGGLADSGFQLPSSPATSCGVPVTFSLVRPNRRYMAQIDAYNEYPADLVAQGSGARLQADLNSTRVAPRWTATCGGYLPSPDPDGGVYPGLSGTAGSTSEAPPGVLSYPGVTQTPHNCGEGLKAPPVEP